MCSTPAHRWGRRKDEQGWALTVGMPAVPCLLPLTPRASGYSCLGLHDWVLYAPTGDGLKGIGGLEHLGKSMRRKGVAAWAAHLHSMRHRSMSIWRSTLGSPHGYWGAEGRRAWACRALLLVQAPCTHNHALPPPPATHGGHWQLQLRHP